MDQSVEHFKDAVAGFCGWAEGPPLSPIEDVKSALSHLAKLYQYALTLPPLFGEAEPPDVTDQEWKQIYGRFSSMPFNYYSTCFDPHLIPAEEPVIGDLADDLADIWRDLKRGLVLFDQGHIPAAMWEWRNGFLNHWGHHAVGAIYALHCWLEQNPDQAT